MYRPSWLNLTSEIEDMISEKKERVEGSSSSSKPALNGSAQHVQSSKQLLTFRVSVAESRITHICQFDVRF